MPQPLRLGLFNFRNDDVLLLAGDRASIVALGNRLQSEFDSGKSYVAIHDIALVSQRHPALLFAARGAKQPSDPKAFVWHCSDTEVQKLLAAGTGASEMYFELVKTPPYFYINVSGHYDEVWWSTYG